MNASLQKYGPPAVVIAITLYLGWPPSKPLDLGDEVVRAKSVRWKASELEVPRLPRKANKDPFEKVLVAATPQLVASTGRVESVEPETPRGPTELDLQKGLKLAGIAQIDSHRWAIVNQRVCCVGDKIAVIGLSDASAELCEIHSDHIKVKLQELTATIRQQPRPRRAETPSSDPSEMNESQPSKSVSDDRRNEEVDEDDLRRMRSQADNEPNQETR